MPDPLFVQDVATLKKKVRLSNLGAEKIDATSILDDAMIRARVRFWQRLGEQRVNYLAAILPTSNPTTGDQILRALAETTEVALVRVELAHTLPLSWMDASGDQNKRWNEEAPFREMASDKVIEALEAQIERDMSTLSGEEALGSQTTISWVDSTPQCAPPRPGDTLYPYRSTECTDPLTTPRPLFPH